MGDYAGHQRTTGPEPRSTCDPEGIVESFPLPGGLRRWAARLADGPDSPRFLRRGNGGGPLRVPVAGSPRDSLGEALPATIARRTGHAVEAAGVFPSVFGMARRSVPRMATGPVVLIWATRRTRSAPLAAKA